MAAMKWFEREFSFEMPAWMFPNVLERLRGAPVRLEERLGSIAPEILTRRDGDSWSIQENAGHLFDLEELWAGRLDDFAEGRRQLRPADLENRKTREARHNSAAAATILASFREARMDFVRRLEEMDESSILATSLHPRLNTPMRVLDMMLFVAEHDDHHLARISELIRKFAR